MRAIFWTMQSITSSGVTVACIDLAAILNHAHGARVYIFVLQPISAWRFLNIVRFVTDSFAITLYQIVLKFAGCDPRQEYEDSIETIFKIDPVDVICD